MQASCSGSFAICNNQAFNLFKPSWVWAKRCVPTRCPCSSKTSTSWWVSAQSSPTYHIVVILFLEHFLGVSGPSITGGRPQLPSNRRLAQESCQGRTIFRYRSSRVETEVFPRQAISSRGIPARPWSKGPRKILTYKETPEGTYG